MTIGRIGWEVLASFAMLMELQRLRCRSQIRRNSTGFLHAFGTSAHRWCRLRRFGDCPAGTGRQRG